MEFWLFKFSSGTVLSWNIKLWCYSLWKSYKIIDEKNSQQMQGSPKTEFKSASDWATRCHCLLTMYDKLLLAKMLHACLGIRPVLPVCLYDGQMCWAGLTRRSHVVPKNIHTYINTHTHILLLVSEWTYTTVTGTEWHSNVLNIHLMHKDVISAT